MKKSIYILIITGIAFVAGCNQKKAPVTLEISRQDTIVAEKPEPIIEKIVEPDRGVNLTDKYFLIFNSYTVEEFAQGWLKIYEKKGYKPALVMRDDNGYFCLALESYNDYKLAREAMLRLRAEPELGQVWIMKK